MAGDLSRKRRNRVESSWLWKSRRRRKGKGTVRPTLRETLNLSLDLGLSLGGRQWEWHGSLSKKGKGTGQGFVSMAACARKLGGILSVQSNSEKGTRVVLDLPRKQSAKYATS